MIKNSRKKICLIVFGLFTLTGITPSAMAVGMELSFRAGTNSSTSDGVYYAIDNVDGSTHQAEHGDGNVFQLGLDIELTNGHFIGLDYNQNTLRGDDTYDTNEATTNDCNVDPLQGEYDDCFDHADVKIDTDISIFDASYGLTYGFGSISLTPYGGIRYLTFSQDISVDYVFPGGNESFPERELDYSGFGLRVGSGLKIPFGSSAFYFKGDLALAKMLSGKRKQKVTDVVTGGPASASSYEESDDIRPLTIDLELVFGYDITPTMNAGIGFGYHQISEILDTRDTANQTTPGAISGAEGLGSDKKDLVTQAIFAEFAYKF